MDAAHENRHHVGRNALCVLSDSQDINKHGDTGKGEPLLQQDVDVGALLVSGLQYETGSSQLPGSSSAPTPSALQTHKWLMMPSRGGGLTLAPNHSPQAAAILSGCMISRSGAWLEERKGSKGAIKRGGKMEVHLGHFYCAPKHAKECIEILNNGFIHP